MQKQNYTDLKSGSIRTALDTVLWGVKVAEGTQEKRGRATFANNSVRSVDLTRRNGKRGTERHCTLDNYNKFQTLLR